MPLGDSQSFGRNCQFSRLLENADTDLQDIPGVSNVKPTMWVCECTGIPRLKVVILGNW